MTRFLLLLPLLLSATACETRVDGASREAAPPPKKVQRRDSGEVKATGVIKPMVGAEVRVGSRVSGVVRRLFVRIGDRVEKGQLLAELDDRDLVSRRREALAALNLARASLDYARADLARKRDLRGLLAPSELDVA